MLTMPIIRFFLLCLGLGIVAPASSLAVTVREPAWAGSFYPAAPEELAAEIDRLTGKARLTKVVLPAGLELKALIMPHAGYAYSGWTAAHASLVLGQGQFAKVILLGVDHRVGFRNGAISAVDGYRTPLGTVALHPAAAVLRKGGELFRAVVESDRSEHSVEVLLPFLQRYLGEFQLLPIVLGPAPIADYCQPLAPLLDSTTLLVVSSDLSHYLPAEAAVRQDRETIAAILRLESEVIRAPNRACGQLGIEVVLELARRQGWRPVLLHYANSGDTAGSRDQVVGYATIAFFGERKMPKPLVSAEETIGQAAGQALVQLAKQTIAGQFGEKLDPAAEAVLKQNLQDPQLQARQGVFVTLHRHGQLRGCIGNLSGGQTIVDGVRDNAINAAFRDYRFSPLTAKEFPDLEVEVSILTAAKPLAYTDGNDLVAKLRVKVDGVIIRQGPASATFLPQVWEQLPDPRQFLTYLCQKAGLPPDAWQQGGLEVSTYQVQYFTEK